MPNQGFSLALFSTIVSGIVAVVPVSDAPPFAPRDRPIIVSLFADQANCTLPILAFTRADTKVFFVILVASRKGIFLIAAAPAAAALRIMFAGLSFRKTFAPI